MSAIGNALVDETGETSARLSERCSITSKESGGQQRSKSGGPRSVERRPSSAEEVQTESNGPSRFYDESQPPSEYLR